MAQRTPAGAITSEREPGTIVVEDEVLRAGFTQVPNAILTVPGLSHGAKLCYALLLSYAWHDGSCFPGQETLGRDLGVERKAVIRYLNELKDKGVIRVIRRGLGKTNVYYLPKLSDVPILGHQEVPSERQLEVPPMGQNEYPLTNIQNDLDTEPSNIRKTSSHQRKIAPDQIDEDVIEPPRSGSGGGGTTTSSPDSSRSPRTGPRPVAEVLARRTRKTSSTSPTTPQKPYPEDRQRILAMIEDFAIELGDEAPLPSSVARAYNLYQQSGIPIEAFTGLMYEARALTKEYSGNITKQQQPKEGRRNPWGPGKNRMAYYFACLEQLAQQHAPQQATRDTQPDPHAAIRDPAPVDQKRSRNISPDASGSPQRPVSVPRRPVRRPVAPSPAIRAFLADLANELGEHATPSDTDQAMQLYASSGLSEQGFLQTLSVVHTMTKDSSGADHDRPLLRFFTVLRQQLGLTDEHEVPGVPG